LYVFKKWDLNTQPKPKYLNAILDDIDSYLIHDATERRHMIIYDSDGLFFPVSPGHLLGSEHQTNPFEAMLGGTTSSIKYIYKCSTFMTCIRNYTNCHSRI
jgi:hypothetical protein